MVVLWSGGCVEVMDNWDGWTEEASLKFEVEVVGGLGLELALGFEVLEGSTLVFFFFSGSSVKSSTSISVDVAEEFPVFLNFLLSLLRFIFSFLESAFAFFFFSSSSSSFFFFSSSFIFFSSSSPFAQSQ